MPAARVEAEFDVVVVGGGHAGTEAAVAAARLGVRVGLVTSAHETIGQLSCNPAIGGIAKGTVVREIDALGGIMGRATDRATIQFRMLNRGKGPAVWAPRAQCDRGLYRRAVRSLVEDQQQIYLMHATVRRLVFSGDGRRVAGIETLEGRRFGARAVVITTGTFLRGRIHVGVDSHVSGGRAGEAATTHLALQLAEAGLIVDRFKTGTPPRVDGRSVNYSRLERQDSELEAFGYRWSAFDGDAPERSAAFGQLPCWITFAGAPTKEIVKAHLSESAMYGGAIVARGPRYCPSIEDKVVRFPDAARHQVFLEPEGYGTHELYVSGLSTSLPAHVQIEMLRSIEGLEQCEMTRPGYAIEYDYFPPTQLDSTLAVRAIPGLRFAGQINGTTGYEEAAAQGVVAGLNAALDVQARGPLVLGRETSYVGVLVDDPVTRGVDDPYRLFTSRSEFRLTVRQDNAIRRLAPIAASLGLHSMGEQRLVEAQLAAEDRAMRLSNETSVLPADVDALLRRSGSASLQHGVRLVELARRQGVSLADLFAVAGVGADIPSEAITSTELEIKYAGYFRKERHAAEQLRRMGTFALPVDAPYHAMLTLSVESRPKLEARRPLSLAQASSVPGVSPADLQNLILEIERRRSVSAG